MSGFSEYVNYDGLGLAELVRKGDVSPTELVEEAISRIETHNPQLNAVVYKMYDQARKATENGLPDGPFKGVPFLLKDLLAAYAGVPMTSGSRFLKDFVPPHDSELVKRYKSGGVNILGKTNTPELGLLPITEPKLFGAVHNPWDLKRTPGGSSGGSGVAVAARMVPLAAGGDGGGSIRLPASACGLFGLKPTRARTPTGPDAGEYWAGLTVEHVLTRSVRDSAAMLDIIAGDEPGSPYNPAPPSRPYLDEVTTEPDKLKIAFTSTPFMGSKVHEDCITGLKETAKLLEELGHEVVEDAPALDREALSSAMLTIVSGHVSTDIDDAAKLIGRKATPNQFETITWALNLIGKANTSHDYVRAIRTVHRQSQIIGRFFLNYDVLLTPTIAEPPILTGDLQPTPAEKFMLDFTGMLRAGWLLRMLNVADKLAVPTYDYVPYTIPFNMTGQPAMSVPLHWNAANLPIGMQFAGRYGDEATLFRLAGQLERACPWKDRTPPGY